MNAQIAALCFAAHGPDRLAEFWGAIFGWEGASDPRGGVTLLPTDDTGFRLRFLPSEAKKVKQNQMHFDLTSSSPEEQQQTVARALELGGRHIDIGQGPDAPHVVMADPEGNEFCVIPAGNKFLAECGFLGAVSSDGSQEVGYFWSRVLGWPLVWDQDQETAIRSPLGGPKITWGGPPVAAKAGPNRLHFDLVPGGVGDAGDTGGTGDLEQTVQWLIAQGAAFAGGDGGPAASGAFAMTDPDGNEFFVWPSG